MNKLTIERTFDAPIKNVWEAWTNPTLLAKWFSPTGMTNTLATAEVKEGGEFRFCFADEKSGAEFYGRGIYQKVTPMTFLSYLDSHTDKNGKDVAPSYYGSTGDEVVESLIEITFADLGEKTKMTVVMDNYYDENMTQEMVSGWTGMFDKLSEL